MQLTHDVFGHEHTSYRQMHDANILEQVQQACSF